MFKPLMIFLVLLMAAVLLYGFSFLHWVNPLKVIDPNSPKFQVQHFRFEDYPTGKGLDSALSSILKTGMPLSEVDKILVDSAKAKKRIINNPVFPNKVSYCHLSWYSLLDAISTLSDQRGIAVFVNYDHNDTLLNFEITGADVVQCNIK